MLLLNVISNIFEIHLDARTGNHDLVFVLAAVLSAANTEVVIIAEFEDVREEVVTLNNEVLNHSISHRIRILDSRDRNITGMFEDSGDDDVGKIFDEMWLESSFAVLVSA